MNWNELKPDIKAISIGSVTRGWSCIDLVSMIADTHEMPIVVMSEQIREKIYLHLKTKNVELGGLLVGSVISCSDLEVGIAIVEIIDAIASQDFSSTSASLSMNPDVWKQANRIGDQVSFVVGWYHSHPNLGAFFSGTDRNTQKKFFNHSYSLGLVVDPIRNEEKWFIGSGSIEVNPQYIRRSFNGMALE